MIQFMWERFSSFISSQKHREKTRRRTTESVMSESELPFLWVLQKTELQFLRWAWMNQRGMVSQWFSESSRYINGSSWWISELSRGIRVCSRWISELSGESEYVPDKSLIQPDKWMNYPDESVNHLVDQWIFQLISESSSWSLNHPSESEIQWIVQVNHCITEWPRLIIQMNH